MDKIAVLIPCYNEEKTIAKVVSDVKKFLPEAVTYVYDNNSTDRTVELATEAGAIIRHEYAQGKGNVIRRMFREIDAECYDRRRRHVSFGLCPGDGGKGSGASGGYGGGRPPVVYLFYGK